MWQSKDTIECGELTLKEILTGLLLLSEIQRESLVKDTKSFQRDRRKILRIQPFLTPVYHSNVVTRQEAQ